MIVELLECFDKKVPLNCHSVKCIPNIVLDQVVVRCKHVTRIAMAEVTTVALIPVTSLNFVQEREREEGRGGNKKI